MSFIKNLMRPFVEFEPEEKSASGEQLPGSNSTRSAAPPAAAVPVEQQSYPPEQVYPSAAQVNEPPVGLATYQKHFEDLIIEANASNPVFQGTDFKEFIDSKADVSAIPDEITRYHTAFNILKRVGLTKEKLLRTGQEYMRLIDNDLKGFGGAYSQQYNAEVEQKQRLLKGKEDELDALNKKIMVLKEEVQRLSQEIAHNKERLDANKQAFFLAGENKKNEIKVELEKIERHFS